MPKRFLLLSPYGGDNLGDGAIQEAFIQHIRRRVPDAEIRGLTLHPELTERIHGIPCRGLSAIRTPFYEAILESVADDEPSPSEDADKPDNSTSESRQTSLADLVKRIPVIGATLRFLARIARGLLSLGRDVLKECARIPADFSTARNAHCLLVAGGGQLDDEWGGPWGHPYVLWKWSRLCKLAGTDFRLEGIGYCNLHHWLSRWFIKRTLKRCTGASFRDQRSIRLAHELYDSDNYTVVPDAAFAYTPPAPAPTGDGEYFDVAISPIAYKSAHYWPENDEAAYARIIKALAGLLVHVCDRGQRTCLFVTSTADLRSVSDLLVQCEELRPGISDSITISETGTLPDLFSSLSRYGMVVASRLHGVILSHLAGLPVLALNYDKKVELHMDGMEQIDHLIEVDDITNQGLVALYEKMSEEPDQIRNAVIEHRDKRSRLLDAHFDTFLSN